MSKRSLLLVWFLIAALTSVEAQQPSPAFGQTQNPPLEEAQSYAPTPMTTENDSLAFSGETERSNYLDFGLSVGSTFDDNYLMSSTNRESNVGYSIFPNVSLKQSFSRLKWQVGYAGGFTFNQQFSEQNLGSHSVDLNLLYRFSPHVNLRVKDNFLLTTNFFDQLGPGVTPGANPQPNQGVITPLSKQIGNSAGAELSYQFSASDVIGGGGGTDFIHYRDVPPGTQLIDSRSGLARGFFNHRLFSENWIGAEYNFQRFTYSPTSDETIAHTVLATFTMVLRRDMGLVLFGGPEYSDTKTQAISQSVVGSVLSMSTAPTYFQAWHPTGGAIFKWNGKTTSVTGEFSRKISSGGGYQTVTQAYTTTGAVRRQFTKSTIFEVAASYFINDPLVQTSGFSTFNTISGNVTLEHRLANGFFVRAGYGHDHQTQKQVTSSSLPGNADRNRAWISFSYSFEQGIGR